MTSPSPERHVLVIEHPDYEQAIHLEAVAYSVGRDKSNAIVLDVDTLSRQHAILLRVPDPKNQSYSYRLVDGNAAGKASTNGVYINGKRCATHALGDGDRITFGKKVQASYRRLRMQPQEFAQYLESIEYQSLKAKHVDAKATLVMDDFTGGTPKLSPKLPQALPQMAVAGLIMGEDDVTVVGPSTGFNLVEPPNLTEPKADLSRNTLADAETIHEKVPVKLAPPVVGAIVAGVLVLAGIGCVGWMNARTSNPTPNPASSSAPAQN
jgi:hypothetical protein